MHSHACPERNTGGGRVEALWVLEIVTGGRGGGRLLVLGAGDGAAAAAISGPSTMSVTYNPVLGYAN